MLHIAICDDNIIALNELQKLTDQLVKHDHDIKAFKSATELIEYLKGDCDRIDIVITDISMPEVNGIQLAKRLKNLYPNIHFIFVTAYTEYIQDVFAVNPVYYVLKPVDREKLAEAIDLAIDRIISANGNTVNIITQNKTLRIKIDDIQYIESINRTAVVHLLDSVEKINIKLDDIEKSLPSNFVRCHKSYLVNMNLISDVLNNSITLFSGAKIPVAKTRFKSVKETILEYWGNVI